MVSWIIWNNLASLQRIDVKMRNIALSFLITQEIYSTGIEVTNREEWEVKEGISKYTQQLISNERESYRQIASEQVRDSNVLHILIEDITIMENKIVGSIITAGSYDNNKKIFSF